MEDLPARLELTWCAPQASRRDIETLCAAARAGGLYGVVVNTSRVELAYTLLEASGVQVVALVGHPVGAAEADAKRYEAELAVDLGAHEIDYVPNLGRLRDGDHRLVLREIMDVVEAAEERPVKVILETSLMTRDEIVAACQMAQEAGAQFVGAGTDFHAPNVTVEEIQLLREAVGPGMGVKAAGGVREAGMAQALINAGATRVGMRATGLTY